MNSCNTPKIDDALLKELHALAAASLSGEPTDEEIARLERLVCENENFRKLYVRYMYVSWNLRALAKYPPSESAAEPLPPLSENVGAAPSELPACVDSDASRAVPPLGFLGSAYHGTVNFFSQEIPFACLVTTIIMGVAGVIGLNINKEHYTQLPWKSVASADRSYADADRADKVSAAVKEQEDVLQFVGRVTGLIDCRWAAPGRKFGSASDYLVALHDMYELKSGLMEITYNSGAKVILQGPCTYEVDSATGGYLSLGKLTARVEKKGAGDGGRGTGADAVASGQWPVASESTESRNPEIPKSLNSSSLATRHSPLATSPSPQPLAPSPSALFAVRTPTAIVTDLGTEFGVEVEQSGETLSHVFQGKVTLVAVGADGRPRGEALTLGENQSARASQRENFLKIALVVGDDENAKTVVNRFVRTDCLKEIPLKQFRRWQAFSEELRKRDDLLAYYDFQRDADDPRDENGAQLMRNRSKTGSRFDGRVWGVLRMGMAQGRFPGKEALKFGNQGDSVQLKIPVECKQMTLTAWINLDQFRMPMTIISSSGWGQAGQLHWLFCDDGMPALAIYNSKKTLDQPFSTYEGKDLDKSSVGQWRFVAVVYDTLASSITRFVDGKIVGATSLVSEAPPACLGDSTIGNWDQLGMPPLDDRLFFGRIDELAIFSTALSAKEIGRMFEQGLGHKEEK